MKKELFVIVDKPTQYTKNYGRFLFTKLGLVQVIKMKIKIEEGYLKKILKELHRI